MSNTVKAKAGTAAFSLVLVLSIAVTSGSGTGCGSGTFCLLISTDSIVFAITFSSKASSSEIFGTEDSGTGVAIGRVISTRAWLDSVVISSGCATSALGI